MIKRNIYITIIVLIYILLFILKECVLAENNVVINEFVIDPQPQQVEIINTGSNDIDISGWYLDDSGGTTYGTIPQNTILYPNSCYAYSGDLNLNKSSADTIRLFNNIAPPTTSSAQLIDAYSYKSSPGIGISFSRIPDGQNNWINTNSTIGYFNNAGLSCVVTPTSTPTPTSTLTLTPTNTPSPPLLPTQSGFEGQATPTITSLPTPTNTPLFIDNVFISEVMVHPKSGEKEWVEIFNNNDFEVNLTDWYIDDGENIGSTPKKFSGIIPAKSYFVFELTSSVFNNDADQVRLLDQNKSEKDSFEYNSSQENISYGRLSFETNDFCLQEPSKGNVNNSCIDPTETPTSTPMPTIKPTKSSITPIIINKITPQFNIPKPKITNVSIYRYIDTSSVKTNINNQNNSGEVLGVENKYNIFSNYNLVTNKLIKLFSYLSFIYSILTIFYILIKIKLYRCAIKLQSV